MIKVLEDNNSTNDNNNDKNQSIKTLGRLAVT